MVEARKTLDSLKQAETRTLKKKYMTFEAYASTNDTITCEGLTTIDNALVVKASDGSSVATSKSGNVLTITATGLSNEHLIGFVVGA